MRTELGSIIRRNLGVEVRPVGKNGTTVLIQRSVGPRIREKGKALVEEALQNGVWNLLSIEKRAVLEYRYRDENPLTTTQIAKVLETHQPSITRSEMQGITEIKAFLAMPPEDRPKEVPHEFLLHGISERTAKVLINAGVTTLEDLKALTIGQLITLPTIGEIGFREILQARNGDDSSRTPVEKEATRIATQKYHIRKSDGLDKP